MADARLIQALRRGEGLDRLWQDWGPPTWSICLGMAPDRARARELLADIARSLPLAVPGWSLDASICCQMSKLVWQRISIRLELPAPASIEIEAPARTATPTSDQLRRRLAACPPEHRVIYLLDLYYRCPSAVLAELSGWGEEQVRAARAAVAWSLVAEEAS